MEIEVQLICSDFMQFEDFFMPLKFLSYNLLHFLNYRFSLRILSVSIQYM